MPPLWITRRADSSRILCCRVSAAARTLGLVTRHRPLPRARRSPWQRRSCALSIHPRPGRPADHSRCVAQHSQDAQLHARDEHYLRSPAPHARHKCRSSRMVVSSCLTASGLKRSPVQLHPRRCPATGPGRRRGPCLVPAGTHRFLLLSARRLRLRGRIATELCEK
jgi:hypothetical protein